MTAALLQGRSMRTLAIDTATDVCSAALFGNGELIAHETATAGRGHAENLIPVIARLLSGSYAERVLVSLGPGSFTGVRIGLAAARALGLVWGAQVMGFPTLALVAATAKQARSDMLTVVMRGGHGEWLVQPFAASGEPMAAYASLTPEQAVGAVVGTVVAGDRAEEMARLHGGVAAMPCRPDTRRTMDLPFSLLTTELAPIYARSPDAKPTT